VTEASPARARASGQLPAYDELPYHEQLRARCGWGVFGDDDQLGTINLLTPEAVRRAGSEIQTGAVFSLSLPLDVPFPALAPRTPYRHHLFRPSRNMQDDVLDNFYPQASSQWDGLRHVSAREFGFYNGVSAQDAGPHGDRLGIEGWARHGIVGRAVLADVARYLAARGTPVDPHRELALPASLLAEVLEHQGTELRSGDILLVRTGFLAGYLQAGPREREDFQARQEFPGLAADEDMARFLWDHRFAAVAADNHSVEHQPGDPAAGFLHRRLIALLGFALGEWFDLEALAADCARDGRYSCFFAGAPLHLPGGVGSPANSVAIK
jgi:kynurenine formamidase